MIGYPAADSGASTARRLLLGRLAHRVAQIDDPDDDPDQANEQHLIKTRGSLERYRHKQGHQHGPEGQRDGLPPRTVGPDRAPLGPDQAPLALDQAFGPS